MDIAPEAGTGDPVSGGEVRDGVSLTNLDQPLFEGAGATKRDLVDYLDAARDRIIPVLADRPLSVVRVTRGQQLTGGGSPGGRDLGEAISERRGGRDRLAVRCRGTTSEYHLIHLETPVTLRR